MPKAMPRQKSGKPLGKAALTVTLLLSSLPSVATWCVLLWGAALVMRGKTFSVEVSPEVGAVLLLSIIAYTLLTFALICWYGLLIVESPLDPKYKIIWGWTLVNFGPLVFPALWFWFVFRRRQLSVFRREVTVGN